MNTIESIKIYLERLKISLNDKQTGQINNLSEIMLSDPLYKSVSKIVEPQEVAIKHFLDCLVPFSPEIPEMNGKTIMDIGTGGGFPCLVFAIMMPDSLITAVDARQKSVDFVLRMAKQLGLKNVKGIHSRIEDLGRDKNYREKSDIVACRALSAIRTLVEYTFPLTKNGGCALYLKGPKLEEELNEAQKAFSTFGVNSSDIEIYNFSDLILPFERNIVRITKKQLCPEKFPRKNGMASSKPL